MQQDSFEVLRNGEVFNRLQQNWRTMDVREGAWLGKTMAVEGIVAYRASLLELALTWEKQENLENVFADFQPS